MSKFMRMIVFFDLPVGMERERKAATKFRNFLIKDGYTPESVMETMQLRCMTQG